MRDDEEEYDIVEHYVTKDRKKDRDESARILRKHGYVVQIDKSKDNRMYSLYAKKKQE